MQTTFDIVIPLNSSSVWDNNELRYALRSIVEFANYGNIVIVGYKPSWLKNVIHIPCTDVHHSPKLRNQNIVQKILLACNDDRVSENFIFTNDDIFLLNKMEDLPNYYDGTLNQYLESNPLLNLLYRKVITNTFDYLEERNLPTIHYDLHCPIIYNKEKFKTIFTHLKTEVAVKSIYANIVQGNSVFLQDNKINKQLTKSQIIENTESRPFLSMNDKAINEHLKQFLIKKYKNKTQHEN